MADQEPDDTRPQPGTAAAAPAGEYHGDAAARVFDIPELLEQILLRLGDDFYTPRKPSPAAKKAIHFPVTELFIIQRVNRTFQNAITDSIKLRRMMFLESAPNTETGTQLVWPPVLFWFLHVLGMQILREDGGVVLLPFMYPNDTRPMWELSTDFLARKDYPTASWRQMKVKCSSFHGNSGMTISNLVSWKSTELESEQLLHLRPRFGILFRKHAGASLGEIRDWLRFIDLTVEDCQALDKEESAFRIWKE